jgi:KDO2-lipid IV(A) lauroyltransferase
MSFKASAIKFLARVATRRTAPAIFAFFRGLLRLVPVRRGVAARNLEIAMPGATREERRAALLGTYDSLVWTGIEFAALQRDPRAALEWVDMEDDSPLGPGGGILLACHVGNWELAAAWVAQSGRKISAIVRESPDDGERGIIEGMRARAGVECIPKTAPMTRAIGVLKRNEFLAIMPDQHGGNGGVKVPLFGIETSTPTGAAVFAYLAKKPIIPAYIRRVAPFKHKMRFGPPLEWRPARNRDETIIEITRQVNRAVEGIIKEAPDQWLAQHRRFREYY